MGSGDLEAKGDREKGCGGRRIEAKEALDGAAKGGLRVERTACLPDMQSSVSDVAKSLRVVFVD